jgi:hypothetical protein
VPGLSEAIFGLEILFFYNFYISRNKASFSPLVHREQSQSQPLHSQLALFQHLSTLAVFPPEPNVTLFDAQQATDPTAPP